MVYSVRYIKLYEYVQKYSRSSTTERCFITMSLFTKIFGTSSQRELKSIYPIADKVDALEEEFKALTDAQLQAKTPELKERLEAHGARVLDNAFVTLERNGDTVVLAGIDDPNGYADQKTPEQVAAEVYAAQGAPFWILLAHRNNAFAERYSLLFNLLQ